MEKKFIEIISTVEAGNILKGMPMSEEFLLVCPHIERGEPKEGVMVRTGTVAWDKGELVHDYGAVIFNLLPQAAEEIPQFKSILIEVTKSLQHDE